MPTQLKTADYTPISQPYFSFRPQPFRDEHAVKSVSGWILPGSPIKLVDVNGETKVTTANSAPFDGFCASLCTETVGGSLCVFNAQ